jgi:excisionase family DNA binding protein
MTNRIPAPITLAEAGEQLRVSPRTVQRMLASGDLVGLAIGGSRRVDQHSVDEYLRRAPEREGRHLRRRDA